MLDDLNTLWQEYNTQKQKPSVDQLWQEYQSGGKEGIDLGGLDPNIKTTMEGVRGRDPSVDYTKGAPFSVRAIAQGHSPQPGPDGKSEQELYLTKYYGSGNVRKDQGGQPLVRESSTGPWMPVFPTGVMNTIGNIGAGAVAAAPTTLGAVAGGALGAPAGPAGVVGGAIGGATLAKSGLEGLKGLAGTYDKSPGELAGEVGTEAVLPGIFQGIPAASRALTRGGSNAARDALQRWGGVTPESRDIARSLERLGVNPPINSTAPGMKIFEYDRRLRNELMTDPMAARRGAAVNTRMREVLGRFGLQGPELDRAMTQIRSRQEALSPQDAAEGAITRLSEGEQGLRTEARTNFDRASELIQDSLQRFRASFSNSMKQSAPGQPMRPGIGPLGPDFEKAYTQAEQGFRQYFNDMYGSIDQMAGGHRYVDLSTAPNNTLSLIGNIFKGQGRDVPDLTQPLTYQEAHTIRSVLRDQAHMDEVSPHGVNKTANLRYVQGIVDNAIRGTEDRVGKEVAGALREADTQFADQVKTFTNSKIQNLVYDIRQGRSPNPDVVANTILDSDSTEATRQIWDVLPAPLQVRVGNAYMKRMMDNVSTQGADGRWTVDPNRLLSAVQESETVHPFITGSTKDTRMFDNIKRLATNLRALGGDVDVTALNQNTPTDATSGAIREHLERALGAQRALVEQAEADPRGALASTNPELVRQGAKWFLGNENRTTLGAERFGVQSPEWQNVQRYAVQEMFKSALKPNKALGETIQGRSIENYLDGLTDRQQRLLFGDVGRDDIRLLARQARALFPEMDEDFGGSLAAASIKGGFSKGKAGFLRSARGYTVSMLAGRIADSPALTRVLVGTMRQNPQEGRALLRWVLEGGMDTKIQTDRQQSQGSPSPDPMQFQGLAPVPKGDRQPVKPNLFQ